MNKILLLKLFAFSIVIFSQTGWSASAATTVKSCDRLVTFDEPPQRAISNDVNLIDLVLLQSLIMVGTPNRQQFFISKRKTHRLQTKHLSMTQKCLSMVKKLPLS